MPACSANEEWATLSDLLDQALDLPNGDRASWIDSLPPEHHAIRPRLRRLLAEGGSVAGGGFLQTIPKVDTGRLSLADTAEDSAPGLENYRILRKLAEGGMGTVWLAHRTDVMVNRPVALKLPRGAWRGVDLGERMAEEREILAALNHPHIARLYDAGLASSGQPYLALEYVEGRPIDQYVKARQLSVRDRLRLFLLVARAVAHAHARLIVHRDLKPANILVTDDGDVKLLDFGIAKLLDNGCIADRSIAEAAAHILTPDYASPEQIAGEALGVATDVYSSGVVLYELLAGVRPGTRRCSSPGALDVGAAEIELRRPSDASIDPQVKRALRGDLDTIVLKALEKRPDDRYATIDALGDDIDRYLRNQPVLARPDSTWYRMSKCITRNKVAVGAAAAVLVAVLAGTGLATWQAHVALTEKSGALEVRDFLITLFRDASPYNAGGRALSALDWLKQVKSRVDRLDDRPALRVELLNIVGSSLLTLQDTAAADEVLSHTIQDGTRQFGPDHPETLRARVLMLAVHRFRGRTRELRAELEQLLPVLRAKRSLHAEDLAIALKNQAHLEIDEGRYDAAELAAQEAVDVALHTLGNKHPETVAALLIRAHTYQYSRGADEALSATERAFRTALAIYHDMPRHPRTIEGRLLYGRALGKAGEPARAVEQLARAVSEAADVFGPASRMVGIYSMYLSEFQLEAGQVTEALESTSKAVDIIAQHTKPESFRYAAALHARGAALLAARRADEALPDLIRATEIAQRTLSAGHQVTRAFQADQALALARAGKHHQAKEVIEALLPEPGSSVDQSGSRALYAMGVIKRLAGDANGALLFQQQALQSVDRGRSGEVHRMRVLTEVGLTRLDLAQPHEAVASLEQALELSRRSQPQMAPDRTDILVGLGRANLAAGRLAEAGQLLRSAEQFWRVFDPDNREAAEATVWLARASPRLSTG
jgi:eukaryotic-like serine/threonine-protein kinase